MSTKIFGKGSLYINGKKIADLGEGEITMTMKNAEEGVKMPPVYECNNCGEMWNLGNTNECLNCGSKDIQRVETK